MELELNQPNASHILVALPFSLSIQVQAVFVMPRTSIVVPIDETYRPINIPYLIGLDAIPVHLPHWSEQKLSFIVSVS
nr:MAG TPA: hypothetical protein [Caudoviricetes sp.]